MKLSKLIHIVSIVIAILGPIMLIGAWSAGENGTFFGLSQTHLFNDAIVFELIAIAASVCTLVRLKLEKDNPEKLNIV